MLGIRNIEAIQLRIAGERRMAKKMHDNVKNRTSLQARLRLLVETLDHLEAWTRKRRKLDASDTVWICRLQLMVTIAVDERLNIEKILNEKGCTATEFNIGKSVDRCRDSELLC